MSGLLQKETSMVDVLTPQQRSRTMRAIVSRNTAPELRVRRLLHTMGFRFRLHRRDLPGTPDIVLPKFRTVVFVNGCFWHQHTCKRACVPKTRQGYWVPKLSATKARDERNHSRLRDLGWTVIVVWECEIQDAAALVQHFSELRAKSL